MATILIFGASGAVGRGLAPRLLGDGERIVGVSRRPPPGSSAIAWIRGDLHADMPATGPADAIVSLGPLDAFAAWFERAAPAGVRRVVALSSMSAESKADSRDAAERELARRLHDAEQRLIAAADARAVPWTVLRPTLIYGGGADRSLAPIVRFARRWRVMPLPIGGGGLRQPVHADDLAAAVAAVLRSPSSAGRIYPLGGGERLPFVALLSRLRAALPGFVLPLPVPLPLLRGVARIARRLLGTDALNAAAIDRLRVALVADNAAAQRDFGYAPRPFVAADLVVDRAHDEAGF